MAQGFLSKAQFLQLGIALQEIPDDDGHLHGELPVLVLFLTGFLQIRPVADIFVFLAVLFSPFERLLELFVVVDAPFHPADDLHFVDAFTAHPQVVFEEVRVHDGTGDTHADGADGEVALSPHGGGRHGAFGKAEDLFLYIGRDGLVVGILHVVSVDAEGGKAFLGVGGQHGSQVYGAGTLRSVEAPHGLDGVRVHIHGFRSVAPAGGYRDGDGYAFPGKFFRAGGGFRHTADGGVCQDAFYGGSVGIAELFFYEFSHGPGHSHRLVFQGFADAVHSSVNGGTDANLGVRDNHMVSWLVNLTGFSLKGKKNLPNSEKNP